MLGAAGQAVCGGQGEGLLQGQQDHTLVAGSARVLNLSDSVNGHIYVEFLGQCQCAPSALPADRFCAVCARLLVNHRGDSRYEQVADVVM